MKTFIVEVTQSIKVTVDETKFTPEFNQEFSSVMWDVDDIEDHVENLAKMQAREMIGLDHFVEGYGDIRKMGCAVQTLSIEADIEEVSALGN